MISYHNVDLLLAQCGWRWKVKMDGDGAFLRPSVWAE
jgi:hypothetical protein